MNNHAFKKLIMAAPVLALTGAVLYSQLSGNDKAPFLVLGVLALNFVAFLIYAAGFIAGYRQFRTHLVISALTFLYAVFVIAAARQGWIDSFPLLGIR